MKKIFEFLSPILLFSLPVAVFAQRIGPGQGLADGNPGGGPFGDLLKTTLAFSNTVLIPFILGIGFLVFVWGMFVYFVAGGANEDKQKSGKSLMIYAVVGFVLVIIFWGAINLIANSLGLEGETIVVPPNIRF